MDKSPGLAVTLPILVLFTLVTGQIARTESAPATNSQLIGQIDYRFVGHLEQVDENGRILVWQADIAGDMQGTMKWWFENPPPRGEISYSGGRLSFYSARWELWDEEQLLLAGVSVGKTNFRDGADGIWDGHGRVTEASGGYESLMGRSVYETGPVILGLNPPETLHGAGVFLVF